MGKIRLEVEIDATNGQHKLAVINFLQAIGNTAEVAEVAKVEEAPKQETAKTEEAPKQETAKTEEAPKRETAKVEEAPKTEKTEGSIDIVRVRALLATKVNDHRTEIKNELTKLGASSVSTLEAEHYQAFYDFLNNL